MISQLVAFLAIWNFRLPGLKHAGPSAPFFKGHTMSCWLVLCLPFEKKRPCMSGEILLNWIQLYTGTFKINSRLVSSEGADPMICLKSDKYGSLLRNTGMFERVRGTRLRMGPTLPHLPTPPDSSTRSGAPCSRCACAFGARPGLARATRPPSATTTTAANRAWLAKERLAQGNDTVQVFDLRILFCFLRPSLFS